MKRKILRFAASTLLCASFVLPTPALSDRIGLLRSIFADPGLVAADPTAEEARVLANRWIQEGTAQLQARVEQIRAGDTLMTILERRGVSTSEATAAVAALRSVYNPRALQVGQPVVLRYYDSQFDGLSLRAAIDRDVTVDRDRVSGRYHSRSIERHLDSNLVRAEGEIGMSLLRSGMSAGIPADVMFQLIKIFSYDVDFQRDIQPGDSFEAAYEELRDEEGNLARTEPLLYASLTLSGKTLSLYRYDGADGSTDYYTPQGASIRKALLRTPIDGAKLTSSFGRREHPILGYTIMHRGVDFGAPSGTPIQAAGDGVIEKIGPNSGYGNYVRLRHSPIYETAYGHMSRFAPGLKSGSHVRQGQVIGYVGATGLATGPHLHYEVLVKAQQVNPVSVKFPTGRQLAGPELKRFVTMQASLGRKLEELPPPAPAVASAGLPLNALGLSN
jgi:murein DD-endopeptidase MepM/ murein hydrolase activator NlpD